MKPVSQAHLCFQHWPQMSAQCFTSSEVIWPCCVALPPLQLDFKGKGPASGLEASCVLPTVLLAWVGLPLLLNSYPQTLSLEIPPL